jgi:hypothetical protein
MPRLHEKHKDLDQSNERPVSPQVNLQIAVAYSDKEAKRCGRRSFSGSAEEEKKHEGDPCA